MTEESRKQASHRVAKLPFGGVEGAIPPVRGKGLGRGLQSEKQNILLSRTAEIPRILALWLKNGRLLPFAGISLLFCPAFPFFVYPYLPGMLSFCSCFMRDGRKRILASCLEITANQPENDLETCLLGGKMPVLPNRKAGCCVGKGCLICWERLANVFRNLFQHVRKGLPMHPKRYIRRIFICFYGCGTYILADSRSVFGLKAGFRCG